MQVTKCSPALAEAFAERLRRGASFKSAAQVNRIPLDTARFWWKRGQLELSRRSTDGTEEATSLTVYAQFAQIVDAAMGEAVLEESVNDIDAFPGAAGNKMAEECDILIRDMVISNPAIAAIP